MLKLAVVFEMRSVLRNRASQLAMLAYLLTGGIALMAGSHHVSMWNDAVDAAATAERAAIEEAHGYFDRKEQGPKDRPWVDLSESRWQDEFSGTRILRRPGPLAGIAAGSVDPAPVAFHLQPWGDPLADAGYRIENPELASTTIDLVFVLSMLTPLLLGVLGFNLGSLEREERIDRLIVVQAGELRGWLVSRALALTCLALVPVSLLCLGAATIGHAPLPDALALLAVATLYTALWGGLLLAVQAGASELRGGVLAYGLLWAVLCILLPSGLSDVGLSEVNADFSTSQTLDARQKQYEGYEASSETRIDNLYTLFPSLVDLPAARADELAPPLQRFTYMGAQFDGLKTRFSERAAEDEDAATFTRRASWLTPPLALTVALERLAGVGPHASSAFRAYLMTGIETRITWMLEQAWSLEPLDSGDFDALVEAAPAAFEADTTPSLPPLYALLMWCAAAWLFAILRLSNSGAHP